MRRMTQKRVTVNGLTIAYRVYGTGPTVLLLHGWPSSSERWHLVAECIAARGFEVIVPDLPGFGDSDDPPSQWGSEDYAIIIEACIRDLKLKNVTLIGHSFGGKVAALIAATSKIQLKQLILSAAAIKPARKHLLYYATFIITKTAKVVLRLPLINKLEPLGYRIITHITHMPQFQDRPAMKATYHAVVKEDIRKQLANITIPTTIIWGDSDKTTPLSMGREVARLIPHAQVHILKGVGHRANTSHPQLIADTIVAAIAISASTEKQAIST